MSFDDATSDAALLARAAEGDAAAAREIVARNAGRLLAVANRMLGDAAEAEDVTQEALLRLWRAAPDWRDEGAQISTWLHRVTLNLCYDRLRKKKNAALDDVAEPEDPSPSVEGAMGRVQADAALRDAIAALPERQRDVITLRHFEERSNPEIAVALGVSVEAVESLLSRGRRSLRAALSGRRDELL